MTFKTKACTFVICFVMFFSIQVVAEIDHIHFGSKNNPLQGVTITWRANQSFCNFKWGYSTNSEMEQVPPIEGRIEFGDKNFYLFDYTFPDLEPSRTIHFAIQEYNGTYECSQYTGQWTAVYSFQTAPGAKSNKFTFIAGGDSRSERCDITMPGWQSVSEALRNTNADFFIFSGDLIIQGGDKAKCNLWFDSGKNFLSQKLTYYSAGNHERYGDPTLSNYLNQFVLPSNGNFTKLYYSFEYGNAAFIFLTTEIVPTTDFGKEFMKKQTEWLTEQLIKYRAPGSNNYKEWVILCFHKPFFTVDKHEGEMTSFTPSVTPKEDTSGDYSTIWWKDLFDEYGVDVILNGHTHLYMRSVPILLKGTGPNGQDITFDEKGIPSKPVKEVQYGKEKNEGRLEIVTGGFGVKLLTEDKLTYRDQWYVARDKNGNPLYIMAFHYCTFNIDGKKMEMIVKKTEDNSIIDQLTIMHK
ncbi:MAG: metallophosphoesterase [Candidatus Aminicenantes bacterium]|nr:metallophosphoesterase [Candidatus Aminicenantes bacterium]